MQLSGLAGTKQICPEISDILHMFEVQELQKTSSQFHVLVQKLYGMDHHRKDILVTRGPLHGGWLKGGSINISYEESHLPVKVPSHTGNTQFEITLLKFMCLQTE